MVLKHWSSYESSGMLFKKTESRTYPYNTELESLGVMSRNTGYKQALVILMLIVLTTLRINAVKNYWLRDGKHSCRLTSERKSLSLMDY